jgi:hypothetical protein
MLVGHDARKHRTIELVEVAQMRLQTEMARGSGTSVKEGADFVDDAKVDSCHANCRWSNSAQTATLHFWCAKGIDGINFERLFDFSHIQAVCKPKESRGRDFLFLSRPML